MTAAAKTTNLEFGVKSQLAKLLATENITMQHRPGAPTAWFDIKNRVLTLPVWQGISEDLYDMLVVHEVGHALDTPLEAWMAAIKMIAKKHHKNTVIAKVAEGSIKDFLNVVEDARIDKRQKRRYPGSKRNYVKGFAELHSRDFFGLSKKDVNTLGLIDRLNVYFKGGVAMGINFTDEEKKFLKRMEDAETFAEVVEISDDLYAYARSNNEYMKSITTKLVLTDEEDGDEGSMELDDDINIEDFDEIEDRRTGKGKGKGESEEDEDDEDEEGDETSAAGEGDDASNDEKEGDDASSKGKGEGKEEKKEEKKSKASDEADGDDGDDQGDTDKDSQSDKNKAKGASNNNQKKTNDGGVPEDYIPQAMTELNAEKAKEEIVLNVDANYVYLSTPKFHMNRIVDDFSVVIPAMEKSRRYFDNETKVRLAEELTKWKKSEADSISFMVKEFEMRKAADTHSRIAIAKTGVLDTNKLHSYKFNDDIFRRSATIPEGKNHGFVMIIDWSGSMASDLKATLKQLFALVLFCKRVQIPFDVYLFRSTTYYENSSSRPMFDQEPNVLNFQNFKLRNVLSSRMNLSMLNRAMNALWACPTVGCDSDPLDSTPLNQSILALHDVVNAFQKKHKVQIVSTIILTDGGSDPGLGYINEVGLPTKRGGNRFFVRDHVTGKVYPMPAHPRHSYQQATTLYLQILKDRTNSNLVGFYLTQGSFSTLSSFTDATFMANEANKVFWNDNGYASITTAGYDEYYVLSIKKMGGEKNQLSISSSMSKAAISKAFTKFSEKKAVNRVLLTAFMKRISNFAK
eukprot:gnl/Spiro4/14474_TR7805_c0_g1_i1.p1 gnl/Spiro4/14474_TR7805_c0_g1~~gnl/Spiro4/14474_TR7805_c0_g1_i1.p1  ORF type:complete len:799 (-),score=171.53 gnl/Spiro4/14474_TR7805_c0_g1_i1:518-2914(-)